MSEEKKYTKEEIRLFVDDTIQKAKSGKKIELTPKELEHVAGGRRRILKTGEVVTEELINRYESMFIDMNLSADALIMLGYRKNRNAVCP